MIFGIGDSIRVTPCGAMVTSMALLFAVYWTVGTESSLEANILNSQKTHQVSISKTFYARLLLAKIPKAQKRQPSHQYLFALSGSGRIKAARKMLMKSTLDHQPQIIAHSFS